MFCRKFCEYAAPSRASRIYPGYSENCSVIFEPKLQIVCLLELLVFEGGSHMCGQAMLRWIPLPHASFIHPKIAALRVQTQTSQKFGATPNGF